MRYKNVKDFKRLHLNHIDVNLYDSPIKRKKKTLPSVTYTN